LYRIRNILRGWFNGRTRPRPAGTAVANQEDKQTAFQPAVAIYQKGDFIDQEHEVCDVLGVGGFGVVYLVHAGVYEGQEQSARSSRPWLLALKTLRDEYLENEQTRERFRREANVWVDLERHPYVVRAHYVREIAGRLYIAMEYIAPDSEGLNSLRGHLERRPPDLAQSLRWAIQFCHGMEYAYAMGVRCHRDIKPDNILISSDHILKITDFGIAGILGTAAEEPGVALIVQNGRIGSSQLTMEGGGFGTPTHMPPEQFTDPAACDERSDIYSFGIVLYQMRTGGKCPFPPPLPRGESREEAGNFWRAMRALHTDAPVPKLNSRLFPVIERCLRKEPRNRYRSFQELRSELEEMLKYLTAEIITAPELKDHEAWEWNNKAASLKQLGRYEEAILCCEKALDIDPQCVTSWYNKGLTLHALGRPEKALDCYSTAVEIDPQFAAAWYFKGKALGSLGHYEEAVACFSKALEIDPRDAAAWYIKGYTLHALRRSEEAIACYSKALEIDPGNAQNSQEFAENAPAWINKGDALKALGRTEEALTCYSKALEIDPRDAAAWYSKGIALKTLGRTEEAIVCCSKALEIDPSLSPARSAAAR
jgi:tetratricopeptide (TPR) repeat protein/tRNA A-37 threonylcarbamoyl transferase component Bud32